MALTERQATGVHVAAILAAAVVVLLGLAVFTSPADATLRILLLVVLVALLAGEGALFASQRRAMLDRQADEAPYDEAPYDEGWEAPPAGAAPAAAQAGPAAVGAPAAPAMRAPEAVSPSIAIRCKQCGDVFRVHDTGARPLVAACTHCGKQGTVKVRSHA